MAANGECLEGKCRRVGAAFVFLSYSTLTTDCRSCLVPVSALNDTQEKGCAMSPAGYFSLVADSAYYSLIPDASTFVQLPWNKELAWVQCNINYKGIPYDLCPRRLLLQKVQEAKEAGLVFKSGIEPEFFIISKDGLSIADRIDASQPFPLHEPSAITRNFPLLSEIFGCMQELGWDPYQIFHETSNGQYEINFGYEDVLITADRLCFLKFMTKQLAEKHGVRATFMPVPFLNQLCASGMHINLSVWDLKGETNLHVSKDGGEDGGDVAVTATTTHFIGGLLKYAREYTALLCPTVNSYKRLNQALWCPNNISWGINDKSVLVCIPCHDRIEHRLADAATNPHLSHAILVACGVEGINLQIEPPENSKGKDRRMDKSRSIPLALNEALNEMEKSEFLKKVLGVKLVEDYVSLKRLEWTAYSKELTGWEMKYYVDC